LARLLAVDLVSAYDSLNPSTFPSSALTRSSVVAGGAGGGSETGGGGGGTSAGGAPGTAGAAGAAGAGAGAGTGVTAPGGTGTCANAAVENSEIRATAEHFVGVFMRRHVTTPLLQDRGAKVKNRETQVFTEAIGERGRPIENAAYSFSAFKRSTASARRALSAHTVSRTKPSPDGPNPVAGVATMPASVSRRAANSIDVRPFGLAISV